ncbi:single-stranded DNA-binding protein [Streptomyces abikoensis]
MNETLVTVVGNVATEPDFREAANGSPSSRFRLAASVRRWDRAKEEWADAYTSFYTVWAWRALAANVVASLGVGEPVVVQGKLRIREEEREGKRWLSADIDAVSIGHDLSRGTSVFRRVSPAKSLPVDPVRMAAGPAEASAGTADSSADPFTAPGAALAPPSAEAPAPAVPDPAGDAVGAVAAPF